RSLRFTFSVSTTSSKPPTEIITEILRVLNESKINYEVMPNGFGATCKHQETDFEVEVCKLPRLSVNGLRFKRLSGNSWNYKNLVTELIGKMSL
ncbi:KA1 domain/Ssp2 C-terminal domain-containing protein, partial [Paraphysoderma sedebokerense]